MKDVSDFKVSIKNYYVTMGDGSVWTIPVMDIAVNRAEYHSSEFDGDSFKSLVEDTLPLFEPNPRKLLNGLRGIWIGLML